MNSDNAVAVGRVPLTVLADRYAVIKKEVAVPLGARQEASRFGGTPVFADGEEPPGKQDARKIAADRLGAGVPHTTLEKVLWLRRIAFDTERPRKLRDAALEAYEEIDDGKPVDWPHTRVHTLVLIDDLEQAAAEAPYNSAVKLTAERQLKKLRCLSVFTITPVMKREARRALATARHLDRKLDAFLNTPAAAAPPALHETMTKRRLESAANHKTLRNKIMEEDDTGLGGGAST